MILTLILIALVGVLILLAGLIVAIGRAFDQVEAAIADLAGDDDFDIAALAAYAEQDARETAALFGHDYEQLADWEKELLYGVDE